MMFGLTSTLIDYRRAMSEPTSGKIKLFLKTHRKKYIHQIWNKLSKNVRKLWKPNFNHRIIWLYLWNPTLLEWLCIYEMLMFYMYSSLSISKLLPFTYLDQCLCMCFMLAVILKNQTNKKQRSHYFIKQGFTWILKYWSLIFPRL